MSLTWEGIVEGYTKNQAIKLLNNYNHQQFEVTDLLNEGYIVFRRVLDKYSSIEESKHLMGLYKTALKNRFCELANFIRIEQSYKVTINALDLDILESLTDNGYSSMFRATITTAPKEIKELLQLALDTPKEFTELLGLDIKRRRGFQNNPLVCKILGYDSTKLNLVKMFKEYFSVQY